MKLLKKPILLIILAAFTFIGLSFMDDWNSSPTPVDQSRMLNIGDKAPELSYPDPQGNIHNLSDLKGKIVLVDFWASWCHPCRMENPHVVKLYDKFHNAKFKNADGFDIYSVSLDRNKTDWVNAIKADNLKWPNQVSDLKFWQSEAAAKYNVNAIPQTFLLDAKGNIIAMGLRGQQLEEALEDLSK